MKKNTGSASGHQGDSAGSPEPASQGAPDAEGQIIPGRVIDQLLLMTLPM